MKQAMSSPPGIKLVAESGAAAHVMRRQFYGARRRARAHGNGAFDGLSIIVQGRAVLLVVRESLAASQLPGVHAVLPIDSSEVPVRIGARGPAKLGLAGAIGLISALGSFNI